MPLETTKTNFCRSRNVFQQKQILSSIIGLLVMLIISFFLIRKVSEYDIWYHMAMGQQILNDWKLPTEDNLCLFNQGRPIHAHLWIFQTIAAAGYALAGAWWLQGIQVAVWSTTLFFTFRSTRIWATPLTSWLLLLFAAIACEERFTIRPEIVTYLMVSVIYWKLQQGKYRSVSELALLTALQWLWTNSHGLFPIGPFMAGCYLLAAAVKSKQTGKWSEARQLGILTTMMLLACLITPHGFENIRYAWLLVTSVSPMASQIFKFDTYFMYELAPPLGEMSRNLVPFWFFLPLLSTLLVSLATAGYRNWQQLPMARTLIALGMLATSLTGIRNIPLFALVAPPLIAELISLINNDYQLRKVCWLTAAATMAVSSMAWSPRPAIHHLTTWVPYRFGIGQSTDYIPWGLPAFLDRIKFSGNIFNSQTLGGFYEYHGYKKRIPFYDYRLEDYDQNELLKIYKATFKAAELPEDWTSLMQRYNFQGILLENGSTAETAGLLPLISTNPNWHLVYLDFAASFWLRADIDTTSQTINKGQLVKLGNGIRNTAQAENLDGFLEKTGLYPEVRQELLEKAAHRWDNALILTNLGILKMKAGDLDEADHLFKRVLKIKPYSRVTLTTLAQIELFRGNRNAAAKYLTKALHYYPDDPDLRQDLDAVQNPR